MRTEETWVADNPEWRPEFEILDRERPDLVAALEAAYNEAQVRDLSQELGVSPHGGSVPLSDQIAYLLRMVKRQSFDRRLVRVIGRHSNHKLKAFARAVLFRQLTSENQLQTLVEMLKRSFRQWDLLFALFDQQVSDYDDVTIRMPDWTASPSEPEFHDRCRELVEILNELPADPRLGLRLPLLQFVRDTFCTPVGTQVPQLRDWLRDAAAAKLDFELDDLVLVDFTGDTTRAEQLIKGLNQRSGGRTRVIAPPDSPQATAQWLLTLPAIRIGLCVDAASQVSHIQRRAARAPSYSALFFVIPSGVLLRDADLPEALRNVSRVQLSSTEASVNGLHALMTGKVLQSAPARTKRNQVEHLSSAAADVLVALGKNALTLFFGPSEYDSSQTKPRPAPSSGFRLGHELVSAVQPSLLALHPLVAIDFAGYVYAVKRHELLLRQEIVKLLALRPGTLPTPHERVAKLFARLLHVNPTLKPLIVTTNLDVLLERALLENGVSFVRFVQKREGTVSNAYNLEHDGDRYWLPGYEDLALNAGLQERPPEDYARLQEAINFYGTDRGGPRREPWAPGDPTLVLYKYHGSADHEDDCECIVSSSDYQRVRTQNVPGELLTHISNRSQLFVGYTILDPQLRHVWHSLLGEATTRELAYAIHTALPADCLDESTPCFGRAVWAEMAQTWFREYSTKQLSEEASAFLASIEAAL